MKSPESSFLIIRGNIIITFNIYEIIFHANIRIFINKNDSESCKKMNKRGH